MNEDIKARLSRNVSVMHFSSKEALYEEVDATRLAALARIEQLERELAEARKDADEHELCMSAAAFNHLEGRMQ